MHTERATPGDAVVVLEEVHEVRVPVDVGDGLRGLVIAPQPMPFLTILGGPAPKLQMGGLESFGS